MAILALNHFDGSAPGTVAAAQATVSPETLMVVREQRRELARLIEPWDQPAIQPAEPPKPFVPRPRGELRTPITLV